jgi:hypothetical protein
MIRHLGFEVDETFFTGPNETYLVPDDEPFSHFDELLDKIGDDRGTGLIAPRLWFIDKGITTRRS